MKRFISLLLVVLTASVLLSSCLQPLKLDRSQLDMTVGDSVELSAGKATRVNWESNDEDVAVVNGGVVTAKSAGTAVITASLESGETASCNVSVADKEITKITLSASGVRIEIGKTIQLSAGYEPADASHVSLSWESSDENVATVDEDGYVTGIWEGTTQITCKSDNGIEASCTVNVGAAPEPTIVPAAPPVAKPTETTTPTEEGNLLSPTENDKPASTGGMLFPDSSVRYLSGEEVAAKFNSMTTAPVSSSYGQDAVNEIYARHGYVFRDPSIRSYYQAQSWYHPDPSYDGSLNGIEQYNVGLFSNY